MPRNTYFRFKQFLVNQDRCGMKVCTDSCIFGAYVDVKDASQILDIGTGTGLLALMAAQRTEAVIDAIEIEKEAAVQAEENIRLSPWKDRIKLIQTDIKQFIPERVEKYDVIICNPPFFSKSLRSESKQKNLALHGDELKLEDLVMVSLQLLEEQGKLWVLLPEYESKELTTIALKQGLNLTHRLFIRERANEKIIRVIACFCRQKDEISSEELVIRNERGHYSSSFIKLLKEYYLEF